MMIWGCNQIHPMVQAMDTNPTYYASEGVVTLYFKHFFLVKLFISLIDLLYSYTLFTSICISCSFLLHFDLYMTTES